MRLSTLGLSFLVLLLLAPVQARPGVRRARLRPTPEELVPWISEGAVVSEPHDRSSVDPVPLAALFPDLVTDTNALVPSEPTEPVAPDQRQAQTCVGINIKPLRVQWNSRNGYCGEMSLQMTAMTRGIYISQKTARIEGTRYTPQSYPDLLFDPRNQPAERMSGVYGVAKMLGLYQPPESYWYMDNMTLSASKTLTPHPSAFAQFFKANIAAGRPVIGGFRVKGGTYPDYDHIMPVYGSCYSSLGSLSNSDTFVKTTNYNVEVTHKPTDTSFYAKLGQCQYTGCIPSDFQDMAVAVGPLDVPTGLYFPAKLEITGWSNGFSVSGEPGENSVTSATAGYRLIVSSLTVGRAYRIYRTTGFFAQFRIPQSAAALASTCTAQGANCRSIPFTASANSMTFSHTSTGTGTVALGQFKATGITYFLAVKA